MCVCLKIGYTPKMDKHGPSNRENYDEPWNLEVPYVQTKPYVKSFLGSSYLVKYVKWCKIGSEKSLYFRIRKIPICVCLKIGYTPKMDKHGPSNRENYDEPWNLEVPYVQTKPYVKSFLGSSYLVKYVKWCKIGSEKSLYFRIRKIPICVCLKIGYTPKMDKHGPSNRENYDEPWNLEVPYVQTKPYVKSFLGSSYLVKYVKWCKIGSEKSLYFRIRKIPICVCLKIGYTPKMDKHGPSNRENYDEPWNLEVPYVQTKPYVKSFLGSSYLVKYVKWCKIGSEKSLYFRIRKIPICVCLKIGYTPKMDKHGPSNRENYDEPWNLEVPYVQTKPYVKSFLGSSYLVKYVKWCKIGSEKSLYVCVWKLGIPQKWIEI